MSIVSHIDVHISKWPVCWILQILARNRWATVEPQDLLFSTLNALHKLTIFEQNKDPKAEGFSLGFAMLHAELQWTQIMR